MPTVTTTDGTSIYYRDWGAGQPIVFSHGWPLTGAAWEAQMLFFNAQGYRTIAHDRRGNGYSDQPGFGNDVDTWARRCGQPHHRPRPPRCSTCGALHRRWRACSLSSRATALHGSPKWSFRTRLFRT